MAEIGLRTYLHQIDGLIEQRQLDDAIAHCKHILTHYPKSLDTYRHLGKALLEKSRHGDAADIFQRVLSALPDDFVAHVGMSIVREDEANLEAALWHMERAFESNPANSAIQEELRRLYGRRDGVLPSRARLTRGALARLYVKGELYPQAEAELRAALADDPERLDLSTLLARVLLETGRRAEATDLVTQILHQLPYSQEGNRLLAEILHAQNRADDAKMYRQRLEALDPYEAFADGHGSNLVNDDVVRVPELAEIQTATAEASATPDWAVSLGETTPFGEPLEAAPGDEPEWLRTGTGLLTAQPAAVTGAPDLPVAGEVPDWLKDMEPAAAAPAPELPDWMKATTGMQTEAPAEPGERPKKQTGSLSGWLKSDEPLAGAEAGALAPADLPDWMKDIAPPAADEPAAQRLDDFPEWMQQAAPVESAPSWMTGPLGPLDEAPATAFDVNTRRIEAAEPAEDLEPGALPEWLKASAAGGATAALELGELPPIDTDELRAIEAGELPAWLKAAGAGPVPAQPAEAETPAAEAEGLPDWLKAASTEPAAGEVEAPAVEAEGLPDWLKAARAEPAAGEVEAPAVEAEGLPDWLQAASAEPAAGEVEAPAVEAEGLPDWLKAIGADSAPAQPAASAVDLPDFLQPASAAAIERANAPVDWEAAPPPTPDAAAEDAAAEDGVPDWIKAMAPDLSAPSPAPAAEDALPPVAEDELPDWLRPAGAAAIGAGLAGLAAAAGPSEPAAEPAAEAEAEALPDWLTFEAEAPAPSAALTPADDMPDWLKSAMEPAAIQPAAAEPAVSEAAAPEPADTAPLSMPAAPVWLPTPAPAEAAEEPAADLPSWAQVAEPPDAVDELGYSAKDVPDWLRQPGQPAAPPAAEWLRAPAEAALPPVGEPALPDWLTPAAPPAPAQPPADMPDLDSMDADEAMRWLETLAARQGAAAEELITRPEDRLEAPPDWITAAVPAPETEVPGLSAAPTPADELPDWLQAIQAEAAVESIAPEPAAAPTTMESMPPEADAPAALTPADELPDWLQVIQAETAVNPAAEIQPAAPLAEAPAPEPAAPAEMPDLASLDDDDAMRWLEGLAARQGAAADELITKPEDRLEAPPDWVTAAADERPLMPATGILPQNFGAAEAEAAPTPADELPDWLKAIQAEAAEPAPAEVAAVEAAAPEPAAPEPATPEPAAPAEMPDLASLDDDDAMRWLEGLAARQGAAADELITKPEDRLEAPPDWVTAAADERPLMPATGILPQNFGAAEAEAAPTPADELPDWLKAIQAEASEPAPAEVAAVEAAAPEPATPEPAAPAEMPDLASLDDDDAMRWLEGLAARQGAAADELITKPEDRLEAPPDWVTAGPAAEPPAPAVEAEAEPTEALPDWLKALQPPESTTPAPAAAESPASGAPVTAVPSWIAGYGAAPSLDTPEWAKTRSAPPAEEPAPIEEPEPEPVSDLPDWIRAVAGPEEPPAAKPTSEPPAWIKAAEPPAAPAAPPAPAEEEGGAGSERLVRLAERLAASRRAKDQEVAERLERQRADREAAHREVAQKLEERRTRQTPGTGPLRPGTGPLRPGTAPLKPSAKPEPAAPAKAERPAAQPLPAVAGRLTRARKPRGKSPYAGQAPADVLLLSRQRLAASDFAGAADSFGHLVHGGHLLRETIAELEAATFNNPNATVLYRVLGDAYMKDNQLQPALDAYRQALAQL